MATAALTVNLMRLPSTEPVSEPDWRGAFEGAADFVAVLLENDGLIGGSGVADDFKLPRAGDIQRSAFGQCDADAGDKDEYGEQAEKLRGCDVSGSYDLRGRWCLVMRAPKEAVGAKHTVPGLGCSTDFWV